jgi:hypothetical protein
VLGNFHLIYAKIYVLCQHCAYLLYPTADVIWNASAVTERNHIPCEEWICLLVQLFSYNFHIRNRTLNEIVMVKLSLCLAN